MKLLQSLVGATAGLVLLAPAVSADVVARAHGRCRLVSDRSEMFDGHCVVKQKQNGNQTRFVVNLDNGRSFSFFGRNKNNLRVETSTGIHNVRFSEDGDRGTFSWEDHRHSKRLAVRLDTRHNPNASYDDPLGEVLGEAIGLGVAALLEEILE